VRTRRSLQDALFTLARLRGVDDVSVADIAEQAGVNRSTFYQHYANKETLLADALDVVADDAVSTLDAIDPMSDETPAALLALFGHVDANAALYLRVFTEPGYGEVVVRLRQRIRQAVLDFTASSQEAVPHDVPLDLVAAGIAGTVVGVMGHWLAMEPRADSATAARWAWVVIQGPRAVAD
jgi:AcrR family transcriptional regulator